MAAKRETGKAWSGEHVMEEPCILNMQRRCNYTKKEGIMSGALCLLYLASLRVQATTKYSRVICYFEVLGEEWVEGCNKKKCSKMVLLAQFCYPKKLFKNSFFLFDS